MALLPSGFALPPVPYLLALLGATGLTLAILYRVQPPVTGRVVIAFAPWMVAGAGLYALYQVSLVEPDVLPPVIAPFFSSPAVYVTTFVAAGLVWAATARFPADDWGLRSAPGVLGTTGGAAAGVVVGMALDLGVSRGTLQLVLPLAGLVVSIVIAAAVWLLAARTLSEVRAAGGLGALVVFAHTIDGVSTAIGTARGVQEQSPLSRFILETGSRLPVAAYLGDGWLFVLVKLVLAVLVTYLLADGLGENPRVTALVFGFVAAVGLGPGAHNLVLFAIGPVGTASPATLTASHSFVLFAIGGRGASEQRPRGP